MNLKRDIPVIALGAVKSHRDSELFHGTEAFDLACALPRLSQCGQKQADQDCDHGNYIDLKKLIS